MELNFFKDNNTLTVNIKGRIDMMTAPEFGVRVNEELTPGIVNIVLNFADVEYLSSLGLRMLLELQKKVSEKGSLKVLNVNDSIMEIFEVTGFANILDIE